MKISHSDLKDGNIEGCIIEQNSKLKRSIVKNSGTLR